jgi:hypothetical protein
VLDLLHIFELIGIQPSAVLPLCSGSVTYRLVDRSHLGGHFRTLLKIKWMIALTCDDRAVSPLS